MTPDQDTASVLAHSQMPDVATLSEALRGLISDHSDIYTRREDARQLRLCEWDGQSPDGRKHAEDLDEDPYPFEGATDSRVRIADTVITEKKAMLVEAAMRAMPEVSGVESGDMERAARIRTLMKWLRDNKLAEELRIELTLAAEYMLADDPGVALVSIWWHRVSSWARETVTLDTLVERFVSKMPEERKALAIEEIRRLVFEPERAAVAEETLASIYPHASARQLQKALKAFREGGEAVLPKPYLREDRPRICAHRLFDDVFCPLENGDPERWPWMFFREMYTEVELREKVISERWDADWVEEAVQHKGKSYVVEALRGTEVTRRGEVGAPVTGMDEDRIEVWRAYSRAVDEDGFPGIFVTVFCPGVKDSVALQEPAAYEHGRMPVVVFRRELLSRNLRDSRGITELIGTHQHEVKVQRDTRGDHAMLATCPPMKVHARRAGMQLVIAPRAQLTVQRSDDIEYLQSPVYPQASIEMESSVKREVDELMGRMSAQSDPTRVALLQQHEVNAWLTGVREVWRQILQVCQQFMSPQNFSRVTGGQLEGYVVGREDIQGQFDLRLTWDVRDSDTDFLGMKLDFVSKLLSLDRGGTIDTNQIVRMGMQALDPHLAETAVKDAQAATQSEVKDEQTSIALMLAGIEPTMQEKGQNHGLRLQTLQQTIQQSPILQAALQQQDSPFAKLAQRRFQHLQFMVQQQANAQTGRVGVQQGA